MEGGKAQRKEKMEDSIFEDRTRRRDVMEEKIYLKRGASRLGPLETEIHLAEEVPLIRVVLKGEGSFGRRTHQHLSDIFGQKKKSRLGRGIFQAEAEK